MEPIEIEYTELESLKFKHFRFGLRIKTTAATYEEDFSKLVIEVKTRLNAVVGEARAAEAELHRQRAERKQKNPNSEKK
jgi:hypothetical protein